MEETEKMNREEAILLAAGFASRKVRAYSSKELLRNPVYILDIPDNFVERVPSKYLEAYDKITDEYKDAISALVERILDENI